MSSSRGSATIWSHIGSSSGLWNWLMKGCSRASTAEMRRLGLNCMINLNKKHFLHIIYYQIAQLKLVSWTFFWTILMFLSVIYIFSCDFDNFCYIFEKINFGFFGDKIGKMFESKICPKQWTFRCFWYILLWFLFFREQNFEKWYVFHKIVIFVFQNFLFELSNLCDEWQLVCHRLVDLNFVTHSQTSPSERPHSSDMISSKNDIKICLIDLQNVETKSSPKSSSSFGIKFQ